MPLVHLFKVADCPVLEGDELLQDSYELICQLSGRLVCVLAYYLYDLLEADGLDIPQFNLMSLVKMPGSLGEGVIQYCFYGFWL